MKKVFKFLCGAASVAAVAFGAYCVYKNVIAKEEDDDDFDDCFDEETVDNAAENREYVSINITEDATSADTEEVTEETSEEVEEATATPEE